MNIAIVGRTGMLYQAALDLNAKGHSIKLIVTAKESQEYTRDSKDFKKLAADISAQYLFTAKINERKALNFIKKIKGLDIGISMNHPSVISHDVINLFPCGILNAHFGDLPRYRGNACPNWAIISGEDSVTLSIHLMEGGLLDCGRVIIQDKCPIRNSTYIGDIYEWAERAVSGLFLKAVELLKKDPGYALKYADPQSPDSLRCYPRRPQDSRIDWFHSAAAIHRLIRASSEPFSGAYCFVDGKNKLTIWRAELFNDGERYFAIPGQISAIEKDHFVVITGAGKLKVTKWNSSVKLRSLRQRLE